MDKRPNLIAIDHDDHHAKHVGTTSDGRQFILTTPFLPAFGHDPGSEFVALNLFDKSGRLIEADIDSVGPRANLNDEVREGLFAKRLASLGKVLLGRVEVAPFSIERFGLQFGLIAQPPEDEDDEWVVEMLPGNYMAFYKPWDIGDYDT